MAARLIKSPGDHVALYVESPDEDNFAGSAFKITRSALYYNEELANAFIEEFITSATFKDAIFQ